MFKKLRQEKRQRRALAEAIDRRVEALTQRFEADALHRRESGVQRNAPRELVVSLTSFSKRIHDVYLTIESLLQQSHAPDRIVLWLSAEEFGEGDIPAILRRQCERGLDIEFVEKDLGPYTKFFYALQKYPEALLLTVDDDILYPQDMVDQLYRAHLNAPDQIHCTRGHRIRLDEKGELLPYKQWWRRNDERDSSLMIFPTGVGGVLYFPGCFDDDIANVDAFQRLAPNADDVWLKAMSLKKGTVCTMLEGRGVWMQRFPVIAGSQEVSLKRRNKSKRSGNDEQIKAVFDAYELMPVVREVAAKEPGL